MDATTAEPTILFTQELMSGLWDELMPLFQAHFEELSANQDIPLSPDRQAYQNIEDAGMLRAYVARMNGQAIGYSVFVVRRNMHYDTSLQAVQDVIWLHPDWRRGGLGTQLLKYCDDALRAEGVQLVFHHQKLAHPAIGVLLRRMGYTAVETIYSKRLDK